ncbi:hypothetical protein C8R47DRAFT_1218929 [Mycena vitilis]|nr:hypothetical protein C8R47DRAFT_1218929 [Mycena vitilis]
MAPGGWAEPEETAWLVSQLPLYVAARTDKTLWAFWPKMQKTWFDRFSEESKLGFTDPDLTAEQLVVLGEALKERKGQLTNWFRNHSKDGGAAPTPRANEEDTLAGLLFGKKKAVKRPHRPSELYQLRNPVEVDQALDREGYFRLNEATVVAGVESWGEEPKDEHDRRIKAMQSARMTIRNRVVEALLLAASQEERDTIDELIEEEKQELAARKGDDDEADNETGERTPAQYNSAIGEVPSVAMDVHRAIEKRSGWIGFSVFGGPNPEHGGSLSMKVVCLGLSPNGNDFEAAHPSFDESISKHFQAFLKRCFPKKVRLARALPEVDEVEKILPSLDGLFRLPDAPPAPPAPAREKPKRIRKKKAKKSAAVVEDSADNSETPLSMPTTPTMDWDALYRAPPADTEMDGFALDAPSLTGDDDPDPFADTDRFADTDTLADSTQATQALPPPPSTLWPEGMGPPSSPRTAAAAAAAERGGTVAGATYVGATYVGPSQPLPIDPVLLSTTDVATPPPAPPRPRPRCQGSTPFVFGGSGVTSSAFGFNNAPHLPSYPPSQRTPAPSRLSELLGDFRLLTGSSPTQAPKGSSLGGRAHFAAGATPGAQMTPAMPTTPTTPTTYAARAAAAALRRAAASAPAHAPAPAPAPAHAPAPAPIVEEMAESAPSAPPAAPFFARSRPMAKMPTAPKKASAAKKAPGRKKTVAGAKPAAKAAAKVAGKKRAVGKGAKGAGGAEATEGDGWDDDVDEEAGTSQPPPPPPPPLADSTNGAGPSAAPVYVMTMGNETRDYNRRVDAERAEREKQAKAKAKKVAETDGVYVLPAPRCPRTRRPVTLPDNSDLVMPVKLTREAQRKKKEEVLLKALQESLGKRPAPEEEEAAPPAKRTKRSVAAAPVAKKAAAVTKAKKVGRPRRV